MPIGSYYGGHGNEVMGNMQKEYGADKGKSVFYALNNKQKGIKHAFTGDLAGTDDDSIMPQPPKQPMQMSPFDGPMPGAQGAVPPGMPPQPPPQMMAGMPSGPGPVPPPPMPPNPSTVLSTVPPPMPDLGSNPMYRRGMLAQLEKQDEGPATVQGAQPFQKGPASQWEASAAAKLQQRYQNKTPWWKEALGLTLQGLAPMGGRVGGLASNIGGKLTGDDEKNKLRQEVADSAVAAKGEREQEKARSDAALRDEQIKGTIAWREEANATRQAALRPPKGDKTAEGLLADAQKANAEYKTATGQDLFTADDYRLIAAGWKPPAEKAEKVALVTKPGDVLRDPEDPTKILATNPATPVKPPVVAQNMDHWIAVKNDPTSTPAQVALANQNIKDLEAHAARNTAANITIRQEAADKPLPAIQPGTDKYKVAQDLADGVLTFPEMTKLYSYARDSRIREQIYSTARSINSNFNPSEFEAGFNMAKNPKVRQQIAALRNVAAGAQDLLKFSDAAERTGVPLLNDFIIKGGTKVGGKSYANLMGARIAFADELSGALGYGTATDMKFKAGIDLTDPSLSPSAFRERVNEVILPFIDRKKRTLYDEMSVYGGDRTGTGGMSQPAPTDLRNVSTDELFKRLRQP